MRIKVKLKQLKAPEAQYVSLVKRSANQIPFRIQKADEEKSMVDLSSIRRVFKGASPSTPKVAAIVVQKGDDLEQVKEAVQKAGFDVSTLADNGDGTVLFAQDADPVDGTIVRMDENVVLVVKNAPEQIQPYVNTLGADGYVDDLLPGTVALVQVIQKCAANAKDADEFKAKVQKAVQEYADFAMGVVEVVPPAAYAVTSEVARIKKAFGKAPPFQKKDPAADPTTDPAQAKGKAVAPAEAKDEQSEKPSEAAADKDESKEKDEEKKPVAPTPAQGEDPTAPQGPAKPPAEVQTSNATASTPQNMQTDPAKADGKDKDMSEKTKAQKENSTVAGTDGSTTGNEKMPSTSTNSADGMSGKTDATAGTGKGTAGPEGVPAASSTDADASFGKTGETAGTNGKTQPEGEVAKKFDAILSALSGLTATIAGLSGRVETVEKAQAEVVQKAAEVEEKMKGVVAAAPHRGDVPARGERVQKSDEDEMGEGFWDSAMARRRK